MSKLLDSDKEWLLNKNQIEMAEAWCLLNAWKWPDDLPNEEPVGKNIITAKTPRRDALMKHIDNAIPHRLMSYTWNKERMTEDEHNEWFDKTFQTKYNQ